MNVRICTALLLSLVIETSVCAAQPSAAVSGAYGRLPLAFEENRGQTDAAVRFIASSQGYRVFVTSNELVLVAPRAAGASADGRRGAARRPAPDELRSSLPKSGARDVIRLELVGGARNVRAEGVEKLPGISNYFIGNDPAKWRTNIPNYSKVRLSDVYRGIDLVLYGNGRQLEYDFDVHPGADPSQIAMRVRGAKSVSVDAATGDLLLATEGGTLRQRLPRVYQESATARKTVTAGYELRGDGVIAFRLAQYDTRRDLTIDPVLDYSTYLGGMDYDELDDIAIDASGNTYLAGSTASVDFPTASPLQASAWDPYDGYIAKLNASGSALVYSTYLGGTDLDQIDALSLDSSGNVFVTGYTYSTDFPKTRGPALAGANDGFVTKLDASGTSISYSMYFGGTGSDYAIDIAVDTSGNAYVDGFTNSTDFTTSLGSVQPTYGGGAYDAFVLKLNFDASAFFYSTYLGGSGNDKAWAIAIDDYGNAFVGGHTGSTDFPTAGAMQPANAGIADGFIAKLNASGSSLTYSTYLGGTGSDLVAKVRTDGSGNVFMTGSTASSDFPITGSAAQPTFGGSSDVFVAKLHAGGASLLYSTYLGGSDEEDGYGIDIDVNGNAYVTGVTYSNDFPTAVALQSARGGDPGLSYADAFVTKVNAAGSGLLYSTYFGGSDDEIGEAICADGTGKVYLGGFTLSTDLPTASPLQAANGGSYDAFLARITLLSADLGVTAAPSPNPAAPGQTITYTIVMTNHGPEDSPEVSLDDGIPMNTTFVALAQVNGGPFLCSTPDIGAGGTVHCGGSLANGEIAAFTLQVKVNSAVPAGTVITNTPVLSSSMSDHDTSNDTATANVTVNVPGAPSSLIATAASGPRVNLTWHDNSGNESGFIVQRCTGASCTAWAKIATVGANVTSYADTGVTGATTYRYRVFASNSLGKSAASNIVQVTTLAVPKAPSSLTATVPSTTSVRLTWMDNSTNETGFKIERCKGSTCTTFAQIATVGVGVRTYTNTALLRATYYRYRVRSYNANGSSTPSNIVTVRTP